MKRIRAWRFCNSQLVDLNTTEPTQLQSLNNTTVIITVTLLSILSLAKKSASSIKSYKYNNKQKTNLQISLYVERISRTSILSSAATSWVEKKDRKRLKSRQVLYCRVLSLLLLCWYNTQHRLVNKTAVADYYTLLHCRWPQQ